MNKRNLITALLAIVSMEAMAQTDSTAVKNDSVMWDQSLDGVTVTAQRQLIKQETDRVGYDVQADEDSRTENVLDMLRKVPMVTIDGEENILVKGNSNYKIYKNGHLDPSLTKNAKEILKAMPASSARANKPLPSPTCTWANGSRYSLFLIIPTITTALAPWSIPETMFATAHTETICGSTVGRWRAMLNGNLSMAQHSWPISTLRTTMLRILMRGSNNISRPSSTTSISARNCLGSSQLQPIHTVRQGTALRIFMLTHVPGGAMPSPCNAPSSAMTVSPCG